MIIDLVKAIFGGNPVTAGVKELAEVFKPNAENAEQRDADAQAAALAQYASEFRKNRSWFDSFIDGINRLPRPLMAFGIIALFASALYNPLWFSERMQGLALVPEPMWWLMGAIVSFYFGARHQAKAQDFTKSIVATTAAVPAVLGNIKAIRALREDEEHPEDDEPAPAQWGARPPPPKPTKPRK